MGLGTLKMGVSTLEAGRIPMLPGRGGGGVGTRWGGESRPSLLLLLPFDSPGTLPCVAISMVMIFTTISICGGLHPPIFAAMGTSACAASRCRQWAARGRVSRKCQFLPRNIFQQQKEVTEGHRKAVALDSGDTARYPQNTQNFVENSKMAEKHKERILTPTRPPGRTLADGSLS